MVRARLTRLGGEAALTRNINDHELDEKTLSDSETINYSIINVLKHIL